MTTDPTADQQAREEASASNDPSPASSTPAPTPPAVPTGDGDAPAAPTPGQPPEAPPPTVQTTTPKPKEKPKAAPLPADMNAEIDAAMAELGFGSSFADAGASDDAPRKAIRGPRVVQAGREHRTGAVVSIGESDIFVEFGPKELGVTPVLQWKDALPAVGDQLEVVVDRYEPDESIYICSKPGAVVKAEWEMLEPGQTVEARVTGTNKGGLELEVASHRAFMPAGQVALERVEDLSVFIGEKLTCQVAQIDRRGKGNIVLSRRDMLKVERKEQEKKLKGTLEEGQTLEGAVRKIMPFGAFIDLGGVDGLVHLSDITHERVGYGEKAVQKLLKEGEQVKVQILKLDWSNNRISLGMKQLQEDPFSAVAGELAEGSIVSGTVRRLADFGVFVEVAPGVEGLVHISEIAYRRIGHPSDVLKEDEVIQVKILKIDPDGRKISLSIKQTEASPQDKRVDEIKNQAETPAMRRLKEKFGKGDKDLKGGLGGADWF